MVCQRSEHAGVWVVLASHIVNQPHRSIVVFGHQFARLLAHVGPDRMEIDFVVDDPIRYPSGCLFVVSVTLGDFIQNVGVDRDRARRRQIRHRVGAAVVFRMDQRMPIASLFGTGYQDDRADDDVMLSRKVNVLVVVRERTRVEINGWT